MTVAKGCQPLTDTNESLNGSLEQPTRVDSGTTLHGLSTPRASPEPEPEAEQAPTHQKPQKQKRRKGRKRRIFGGTLLAIAVVACAVSLGMKKAVEDERVRAAVNDGITKLNDTLAEHLDVTLDGFLESLANLSDKVNSIIGEEGLRPGQLAAEQGLRAHHPVIIIPGFVTSGLELWQGESCAQSYFRQRLWGALSMAQTLLKDRMCWLRHMKLDPVTGSDPPGIKLRAAKSLEAVDYFVPGYWVFSKMVQNLADLGYDNNNLVAVPYDWRLPIAVMESRDGFFTRVKTQVELQHKLSRGIKPVMVSHSYGAAISLAFFEWVEKMEAGWVDKHLHGYVNLAGPLLGLPKAISPLLSGETRETVDIVAGLAVLVEQYLGKQSRAGLFRTWGSTMAMLPVGGDKVWGNASFAPDDDEQIIAAGRSYGGIIARIHSVDDKLGDAVSNNDSSLISSESLQLLRTTLSNWGNIITSLGSSDSDADQVIQEDEREEAEDRQAAAEEQETHSKEPGGQHSKHHRNHRHGAAGSREDSVDNSSQLQADCPGHDCEAGEVRFLDVGSAITSLAMTAGLQFTLNLQQWAPAAQDVDLSKVLQHHGKEAEELRASEERQAQQQQNLKAAAESGDLAADGDAFCDVSLGDYKGSCSGSKGEDPARGSKAAACTGTGRHCSADQHLSATAGVGDEDAATGADEAGASSAGADGLLEAEVGAEVGGEDADGIKEDADAAEEVAGAADSASNPNSSGDSAGSGAGRGVDNEGAKRDTQGVASQLDDQPQDELTGSGCGVHLLAVRQVAPVNPVHTPLPKAPKLKLYCFYGIGVPTERGYHYLKTQRNGVTQWSVNNMINDPDSGLLSGVQLSPDGDGTVPLLSLGALCAGGWKTRRLNPSGIQVVVREYPNNPGPALRDARGGPGASTHVELLGNEPMLMDLLSIVSGKGESMEEQYHSDIRRIASRIPWDSL